MVDRIVRVIRYREYYWHNFSLKTLKKLRVIRECMKSKDKEKIQIGKKLLHTPSVPFFPYSFVNYYDSKEIRIQKDEDGYPFVMHGDRRLFLKREWSEAQCQNYYNSLLMEQDEQSPHRYLKSQDRYPDRGDIVADIGAAEGIFGLDVIEKVKKLYLFEADNEWLVPLKKTFCNWEDKIEIISKYVSNEDGDNCISLNVFFKDRNITYLKADIEGAEELMLIGGEDVLREKVKKALICTYHRPNDEVLIKSFMEKCGFKTEYNDGYVLFIYNVKTFKPPYLRKCLLYGYKL